MGKKITLTTEELDRIIKEVASRVLKEGIDIDKDNLTVGFNPSHQNYINTNDPWNPIPIYNIVDGKKVISIFERKCSDDGSDGNPLIYALKGKKWKFKNPHFDIMSLLRRFVAVTKELKEEYDLIITTPSSNKLNTELLYKVERLIPHSDSFENFFVKYTADEVYKSFIDDEWLERTYSNKKYRKKIHSMIYRAICQMNLPTSKGGNDGIFSYKFIKPTILRQAILQSMSVSEEFTEADRINGKNVLIIDDTVTSGKTLSDSAKAILQTYDPKSITFLTLFSPLTR